MAGCRADRTNGTLIFVFGVTDHVKSGDITIEYCPTEMMLTDFFTKPLQGAVFHKFRDVIMG